VSHVDYVRAVCPTKVSKRRDRQTDGRQTEALRFLLDAARVRIIIVNIQV